jgi:hypothetical protein
LKTSLISDNFQEHCQLQASKCNICGTVVTVTDSVSNQTHSHPFTTALYRTSWPQYVIQKLCMLLFTSALNKPILYGLT